MSKNSGFHDLFLKYKHTRDRLFGLILIELTEHEKNHDI